MRLGFRLMGLCTWFGINRSDNRTIYQISTSDPLDREEFLELPAFEPSESDLYYDIKKISIKYPIPYARPTIQGIDLFGNSGKAGGPHNGCDNLLSSLGVCKQAQLPAKQDTSKLVEGRPALVEV